jgi:hypothetical protein
MPDELDVRICNQTTKHAQLGNTGSCMCGTKKYKVEPEGPFVGRCPFCAQQPEVVKATPTAVEVDAAAAEPEVFCATEGCVAFTAQVPLSKWNQRAPHELEVMRIPTEEPIFVLRAQDKLALVPVYNWIELAERKNVPDSKTDAAVERANEMQEYQRGQFSKIPD